MKGRADEGETERARRFRAEMGECEKALWSLLRGRRMAFKFRRQFPLAGYVLDFYCAEARLCIEVDGDFHQHRVERDQVRDEVLLGLGVETLRIPTSAFYDGSPVLEWIWERCSARVRR